MKKFLIKCGAFKTKDKGFFGSILVTKEGRVITGSRTPEGFPTKEAALDRAVEIAGALSKDSQLGFFARINNYEVNIVRV